MNVPTPLAATDFGDITQIIVYLVLAAAGAIGSVLSQKRQSGGKSGKPAPPTAGSRSQPRERPSGPPPIRTRGTDLPRAEPAGQGRPTGPQPPAASPARAVPRGVPTAPEAPRVHKRVEVGRLRGRIAQREPLASRLTLTIHARPGLSRHIAPRAAPGHLHDATEPRPEHHVHVAPETGRRRARSRARAGEAILKLTRSSASLRSAVVLAELLAAPRGVEDNPRL